MRDDSHSAKVKVVNSHGMHLRPASLFVRKAKEFQSKIEVRFAEQTVDGRSVVDLLMLAARSGTELEIVACGDDAPLALAALIQLVTNGFDEMSDESQESSEAKKDAS